MQFKIYAGSIESAKQLLSDLNIADGDYSLEAVTFRLIIHSTGTVYMPGAVYHYEIKEDEN